MNDMFACLMSWGYHLQVQTPIWKPLLKGVTLYNWTHDCTFLVRIPLVSYGNTVQFKEIGYDKRIVKKISWSFKAIKSDANHIPQLLRVMTFERGRLGISDLRQPFVIQCLPVFPKTHKITVAKFFIRFIFSFEKYSRHLGDKQICVTQT